MTILTATELSALVSELLPVATLADLAELAAPDHQASITVQGALTAGDGGGGEYWWDAASSDSDNSATIGTVIAPDAGGTGRWKLWMGNGALVTGASATLARTFNTIALLKATTARFANERVSVLGYHSAGDGGGGEFWWDSASSATDNGGTILAADAGGVGRWRALHGGSVTVKQFGAKGDNSNDDTAAFQAAIDSGVNHIFIPEGGYRISALTLSSSVEGRTIVGAGRRETVVYVSSATANVFDLQQAAYNTIGNFSIRPVVGTNRTAGAFFRVYGGVRNIFEKLDIRTPWDGFVIADSVGDGSGTSSGETVLRDISMAESAETGWNTALTLRHAVNTTLDRVTAVSGTGLITGAAFFIIDSDVDTLTMSHVGAGRNDGGGCGFITRNTASGSTFAPRWIEGTNLYFEGAVDTASPQNCVTITAGNGIHLNNLYTASGLRGIGISGGQDITIGHGIDIAHDREGVRIDGAGPTGVLICGRDITAISVDAADTYDCIEVAAGANIEITHNKFARTGSNRRAVTIGSGVTDYHVHANQMFQSTGSRGRVVDNAKDATGIVGLNRTDQYIITTLSATETTFSIGGFIRDVVFNQSGATNFATFTSGQEGQEWTARFNNANTTLVDGATLQLAGSANYNPPANTIMRFRWLNSVAWEVSRSNN